MIRYNKLRKVILIALLVCSLLFIANYLIDFKEMLHTVHIKQLNTKVQLNSVDKKKILLWTSYFDDPKWLSIGEPLNSDPNCGTQCELTTNRSLRSSSLAVLFHWNDIKLSDLPPVKYMNQRWIIYGIEPPTRLRHDEYFLTTLDSVMDMTMNYRTDADIYSPYGSIEKLPIQAHVQRAVNVSTKSTPIAWFVSHCRTSNKREEFVKRLQMFIDVDVYGSCGSMSCLDHQDCYRMLEQKYYFYLSFENSNCDQYVTEKLFNILQLDVVPVVLDGRNYKLHLPNNSVIKASDFKTVKQLAAKLNNLIEHPNEYRKFFDWKNSYKVSSGHLNGFCALCSKVSNNFESSSTRKLASNFINSC